MGEGFVKLFSSILDSSVWEYDAETRLVWITLLAMADSSGRIHAAVPGIANRARVSIPKTEEALIIFQSPDKYSRSKNNEGRRIALDGRDWIILNFEAHRSRQSREKELERKRRWWRENKSKKALDAKLDTPSESLEKTRRIADTEADTEADTDTDTEADPDTYIKNIYSADFLKFWAVYPIKKGRRAAYNSWKRLKNAKELPNLDILIAAVERQKNSKQWQGGYIPHPTTWLNQGRWDDVTDPTPATTIVQGRIEDGTDLRAGEDVVSEYRQYDPEWVKKQAKKRG